MKLVVLMLILRLIFLLIYLIVIFYVHLLTLVQFLFSMGESTWLFSSIHVHLYIFILIESFNWQFGSIFVNIKFGSLPK